MKESLDINFHSNCERKNMHYIQISDIEAYKAYIFTDKQNLPNTDIAVVLVVS